MANEVWRLRSHGTYDSCCVTPAENNDVHEEGSSQPFILSLYVSDKVVLDWRWVKKQLEQYSDRGAIENLCSSIKNAVAWTTSKE